TVTLGREISSFDAGAPSAAAASPGSGGCGPPQATRPTSTPVHSNARPLARKTPPLKKPCRPWAGFPLGYPSQYAQDQRKTGSPTCQKSSGSTSPPNC